MLSVIAVAMAGIAFVATRGGEPTEREVTTVARHHAEPVAVGVVLPKDPPQPPAVQRGKVLRRGLQQLRDHRPGRHGVWRRATGMGWKVVGADNWYGTIPATTVYYPAKPPAAKQLALDLGIKRTAPAVDPMRLDRLTVILTAPLS